MTIRYECEECGSVLKIKDELAGTDGKCPKCKKRFVVPDPEADEIDADAEPEPVTAEPTKPQPTAEPAKPKVTPPARKKASDDDFDPADFLMEGNSGGSRASAGLGTPEPAKPAPLVGGRRPIAPPAAAAPPPIPAPPNSAAAAASAMMGASANARDLLTKTAEESRTKSATMPEEKAGPRYDFTMLFAQLRQYTIQAVAIVVAIPVLYIISTILFGDSIELPKLAEVSGTVILNDKPLPGVKVILSPVTSEGESTRGKKIKLRSAEDVTADDGSYSVWYMPGHQGAPLGKVKVSLEPLDPVGYKNIPPEYLPNAPAAVILEVREAGNTSAFTLNLKK